MSEASPRRRRAAGHGGWLPHPLLSAVLVLLWLLLQNRFSLAHLALGLALGIAVPRLTRGLWPARPRIRRFAGIAAYCLLVAADIVRANIDVARLILFRRAGDLRPRWVCVPLELTSAEAITVLAGTITMTPGTVSCDLSADGRSLLVHCLDAPDAGRVVQDVKTRYEARLKEIFE